MFQTEYEFDLPKGFYDQEGKLHKHGIMRLSTAKDEVTAARDPRCRQNQDYIMIVLLSKVVTQLGSLKAVTPETIEELFSCDFSFLQNMYTTINDAEEPVIRVQCPHCGQYFNETLNFIRGE